MKKSIFVCNQCEDINKGVETPYEGKNWITFVGYLRRHTGLYNSDDRCFDQNFSLDNGDYHFCSTKCFLEFLKKYQIITDESSIKEEPII